MMVEVTCKYCGAVSRQRWQNGKAAPQFCNRKCSKADKRELRICVICGNEFEVPKTYKRKTCSDDCRFALYSLAQSSPQAKEWHSKIGMANTGRKHIDKLPPHKRICKNCGNQYEVSRHYGKKRGPFCKLDCWYEYIRNDPNNHPSFKGGRFPYYGGNWNIQSAKARELYNHTCQRCGKYQKKPLLDVHHIIPRRHCKSWRSANALNNLVTLCKSCHKIVEPK